MNLRRSLIVVFSMAMSLLAFVPLGYADCSSVPINAPHYLTDLVPDQGDSSPIGSRTALVIVHGIHGRPDHRSYWASFLTWFYSTSLPQSYKVFRFEYDSDQTPVALLSDGFRSHIETAIQSSPSSSAHMNDAPIAIVAHSMGGLVARSYMMTPHYFGNYCRKLGGERVLRLLTLAPEKVPANC